MFSYSSICESGLFDNKDIIIVHPDFDKIVLIDHINKFFFGVSEIPITNCMQFFDFHNITIYYKKENYLVLSKLKEFFDGIGCLDKYETQYIPINYYNFIGKQLCGIHKNIYDFNKQFIEYLNINKPLYFDIFIDMIGRNSFNGKLIEYSPLVKNMSIIYDGIVINYLDDNIYINVDNICVSLINNYNEQFKNLYNMIKIKHLMKDIDTFVIYNLTKITKSKDFSKLLVESHNKKDVFCISIDIINNIINFKNEQSKKEYIERFIKLYKENIIWSCNNKLCDNTLCDNTIYVNFEGFNKYFLNLESGDLESHMMKEIILNFYYNITNELINSYKSLYYSN